MQVHGYADQGRNLSSIEGSSANIEFLLGGESVKLFPRNFDGAFRVKPFWVLPSPNKRS